MGLIGGIGYVVMCGMPCGIYTGRNSGVGLEVYLMELAVSDKNGSAKILTHMELHVVSGIVAEVMAVDALSAFTVLYHLVGVDDLLVKRGDVTLVYAESLIALYRRHYETVCYIRVDHIGSGDAEFPVTVPFPVIADIHLNAYLSVLLESVPFA